MPASTEFQFGFGRSGKARDAEDPMRLLVMGDFGGRPSAGRPALAERPAIRVDLDNLDSVVARLAPRIATAAGEIAIESLDDFHPDALFQKLDLFRVLREARSRPAPQDGDSPLAALLGGTSLQSPTSLSGAASRKADQDGLDALVHRIVAPHIVPDTSAQTQVYRNAVDSAVAEQMRAVLHAPSFQEIEAAWRGVQWLVSRLELDENLQLHLLDVSRDELLADLDGSVDGDVEQTATYAALVNRSRRQPGVQGWSAVIGLYQFGPVESDVRLLAALGAIASHAGGPFLAGADKALWQPAGGLGDRTAWAALRNSPAARWIGLVGPRMLLRRPYGARDEPVDAFAFEELGNTPSNDHYLWVPGALGFALLLGRGYSLNQGWSFSPGDEREIDDLPSCTRLDRDGEPELVPCAEFFLADREADDLLGAGVMPLLSHRHRNVAMLMRVQSISEPAAALMGLPE